MIRLKLHDGIMIISKLYENIMINLYSHTVATPCDFIYFQLLKGPKFDPHLWQIFWLKYIPDLWTLT